MSSFHLHLLLAAPALIILAIIFLGCLVDLISEWKLAEQFSEYAFGIVATAAVLYIILLIIRLLYLLA